MNIDGEPSSSSAAAARKAQGEVELEKERRRRDKVGKKEWGKLCAALWKGSKSVLGLTSSAFGGAASAGADGMLEDDVGGVGSSPLDLALAGATGGLDVMQCLVLYSYCNQNLEQRGCVISASSFVALALLCTDYPLYPTGTKPRLRHWRSPFASRSEWV